MGTKVFISYRFSDIPLETLHELIDPIVNFFTKAGLHIFCNLYFDNYYKENNYTPKQIMDHCFQELEGSDFVICLFDTNKYSCGLLLEIGYALANKKNITVFTREGCEIDTLIEVTNRNYKYNTNDELYEKIKERFAKYLE